MKLSIVFIVAFSPLFVKINFIFIIMLSERQIVYKICESKSDLSKYIHIKVNGAQKKRWFEE